MSNADNFLIYDHCFLKLLRCN